MKSGATATPVYLMRIGTALGVAIFLAPVLAALAEGYWTTEQGAHGPLLLASGLWLLWTEFQKHKTLIDNGSPLKSAVAVAMFGSLYFLGDTLGAVPITGLAALATICALLYHRCGYAVIQKCWFPLLFLLFVVPLPGTVVLWATAGLKQLIVSSSVSLLSALNFNVGSNGSAIFIDQYQLTVVAACSGLNSLITLSALGVFYVYISQSRPKYYIISSILLSIIAAIFANFARIIILIICTKYMGERFTTQFLHNSAGVLIFTISIMAIAALDKCIWTLWQSATAKRYQKQ
jgi:exosortase